MLELPLNLSEFNVKSCDYPDVYIGQSIVPWHVEYFFPPFGVFFYPKIKKSEL